MFLVLRLRKSRGRNRDEMESEERGGEVVEMGREMYNVHCT